MELVAVSDIKQRMQGLSLDKKLMAPAVQLTGHEGEVNCIKFSRCGEYLASAGHDRVALVWDVFDP